MDVALASNLSLADCVVNAVVIARACRGGRHACGRSHGRNYVVVVVVVVWCRRNGGHRRGYERARTRIQASL